MSLHNRSLSPQLHHTDRGATSFKLFLQVMFFFDCLPERDHVAQFCGQAAELIGRQVQVDQVGQLGDVRGDAGQVVVVDVQRGQVGERP